MNNQEKKEAIKQHVRNMLKTTTEQLEAKMNKVFNSGAIDTDEWDENHNPILLPKAILIAFLEDEANQYKCEGTSHEKYVREESKNIKIYM